jgi:hypothetical protein
MTKPSTAFGGACWSTSNSGLAVFHHAKVGGFNDGYSRSQTRQRYTKSSGRRLVLGDHRRRGAAGAGQQDEQAQALEKALQALSDQDLVDFIDLFAQARASMCSWRLWAAADVI